jgi:nitroreductase
MTQSDTVDQVARAIESRRSVRAFKADPVPRETIEHILQVASRAPSGNNIQPWQVFVLTGKAKDALSQRIMAVHEANMGHPAKVGDWDYDYYPRTWVEPFLSRRRATGYSLYALLSIRKDDKARMHQQMGRNYRFFDAPVGMIFTTHRSLEKGAWIDMGCFIQNVMTMARAYGLHTCPQAAFVAFHKEIKAELKLGPEHVVICGMALGYEDETAAENQLRTEREGVHGFATFLG